jgi:hypothetical protein
MTLQEIDRLKFASHLGECLKKEGLNTTSFFLNTGLHYDPEGGLREYILIEFQEPFYTQKIVLPWEVNDFSVRPHAFILETMAERAAEDLAQYQAIGD